jgi:hypothetical protein
MSRLRHSNGRFKSGGAVRPSLVSGNPKVIKEARARKDGGAVFRVTGGAVKARSDRPARARGGGVGADKSPFSSARKGSDTGEKTPSPKDTYGGTPSG